MFMCIRETNMLLYIIYIHYIQEHKNYYIENNKYKKKVLDKTLPDRLYYIYSIYLSRNYIKKDFSLFSFFV